MAAPGGDGAAGADAGEARVGCRRGRRRGRSCRSRCGSRRRSRAGISGGGKLPGVLEQGAAQPRQRGPLAAVAPGREPRAPAREVGPIGPAHRRRCAVRDQPLGKAGERPWRAVGVARHQHDALEPRRRREQAGQVTQVHRARLRPGAAREIDRRVVRAARLAVADQDDQPNVAGRESRPQRVLGRDRRQPLGLAGLRRGRHRRSTATATTRARSAGRR